MKNLNAPLHLQIAVVATEILDASIYSFKKVYTLRPVIRRPPSLSELTQINISIKGVPGIFVLRVYCLYEIKTLLELKISITKQLTH